MSTPMYAEPAMLVVSILASRWERLPELTDALAQRFGPAAPLSRLFPFDHMDYYAPEMGEPITRRFAPFETLLDQDRLPWAKTACTELEEQFSIQGNRLFNLDPGLLCLERFILATGKNFLHRIYLGQGVWADLTLLFREGGFKALEWTFPDYASWGIRSLMDAFRDQYLSKRLELQQKSPS